MDLVIFATPLIRKLGFRGSGGTLFRTFWHCFLVSVSGLQFSSILGPFWLPFGWPLGARGPPFGDFDGPLFRDNLGMILGWLAGGPRAEGTSEFGG